MRSVLRLLASACLIAILAPERQASAQALPTTQPGLLQIIIEDIKIGHDADHVNTEAGWPAAFERAKSSYPYIALAAMTGRDQVWFVVPYESHTAMAASLKQQADNTDLAAELARLSRVDAEHVDGIRTIQAVGRKDLSHGAFPDIAKQRFWEITLFRVRPGHEADFVAAAKAYGSATGRAGGDTSYRVYEVIAGMPGPTYLVFSSVASYADFDKTMAAGEATMKGATADEAAALQKFSAEALINAETHRFRLDPQMSYVPADVRTQDPAFWMPKKAR